MQSFFFVYNHTAPNLHKSMIALHWKNHRLCAYLTNDFLNPPPPVCKNFIKFIVPPVHLTHFHFALFVVNLVLTWLFLLFFFGFVVALVLCVKPAPEQQRLDDAIGYLREHAEVRNAEFQFFFPSPFYSFRSRSCSLTHVVFAPRSRIRCKNIALFGGLRFPLIMIIYCAYVIHNL